MKPPWKEFDYPYGSLGWRMGAGEDYIDEWFNWFNSLKGTKLINYIKNNPAPNIKWKNEFYKEFN